MTNTLAHAALILCLSFVAAFALLQPILGYMASQGAPVHTMPGYIASGTILDSDD